MSEQDNIRLAEKFFEALNKRDLGQTKPFEASDFRRESPGVPGTMDASQGRAYDQGFLDAFPDLHFDLKQKVAQGDYVVINWVATGTQKGSLRTPEGDILPPTGKKGVVPGSTTFQIRNGKVSYVAVYWDMITLLNQLGLVREAVGCV
jgi:steroid delta-isomerase-like uncharacterized protein